MVKDTKVRRYITKMEVIEENLLCMLDRMENMIETGKIKCKHGTAVILELVNCYADEDEMTPLQRIIFDWVDRIEDRYKGLASDYEIVSAM